MRSHVSLLLAAAVFVHTLLTPTTLAQSTALTYQGQLKDNGVPTSGLHDFRFKLFDAPSGGSQVGATQCADNVPVSEGVFTAVIDFGNQFTTPATRFIEIDVRVDTGLTCIDSTGFTTLTTRQILTPTPLATHAKSAFSLDAANGSIASAVFVDNAGRVGLGTLAPTHRLHIADPAPTIALQDTDSTTQQVGYLSFRDSANTERAWIGYGSVGDPDLSILNARPSGDIILTTLGGGRVGIGTGSPAAPLEVRGDIRLGSLGQHFALRAEQSDRTLRGTVGGTGIIQPGSGSGFTITQTATGRYTINFTQPFTTAPTVVVTSLSAARQVNLNTTLTTAVGIQVTDLAGTDANGGFTFIVMGQ